MLQKYIKSFPVFNCPESKIFKLNQYFTFNKITEDKNINIINNVLNKSIKKIIVIVWKLKKKKKKKKNIIKIK